MRKTENAIIRSADIDIERMLNYWVHLDFGDGTSQSFGGYFLAGDFGCKAISKLLEVVEVEKWSQLYGRSVRADHDFCKVYRLGNFLKDKWLDLEELAKPYRASLGGAE